MRPVLVFALSGAFAVVIQTTLLRHLPIIPVTPDLILILCVFLGLHFHSAGGALGAFLLGYLLDTFAGTTPGLYCLAMTLVFSVVYLVSKRLWMENPVSNIAAVVLGSAVKVVTVLAFFALAAGAKADWLRLARVLSIEAVLSAACTPLVFSALRASLRTPPPGSRTDGAE